MTAPENVQAARFYGEVFGLPTWTDGGVGEVGVGLSVLLFYPGPVEPGAYYCVSRSPKTALLRPRPGCRSGFSCWSGTETSSAPWNSQSLYFAGTHGILLELIARHDLPAALSGRFTSADLLRMREIVLAAPDVALQNAFGLPAFGHRRGRVHPARRSQRAADLGPASPPWFPATTVTPSLGPIEVTAVRSPRRPRTPRRSPRGLLSHRRGPSVRSIWSRAILKD
jgi:hypothetical protein